MNSLAKNVLLSVLLPAGLGFLAVLPIINSENGYVAGFVFLPLFVLVVLASFGLFIAGLIATGMKGLPGLWVLLSSLMLFGGFMGTALISKEFEIGSYREDPMVPFLPDRATVILFKDDATDRDVEDFKSNTIATSTPNGEHSLPGLRTMMDVGYRNGHRAIAIDFFSNATLEERDFVLQRIRSSPITLEVLEDTDWAEKKDDSGTTDMSNSSTKKATVVNSTGNP